MKLYIVILCYRVVDLTIDCLKALSGEIGRVPGTMVGLLENGTGDDSADRLRQAIDENGWNAWVDLIVVHPNLGFTGGNNVVIRRALESADPPDYVLLLNSDTIVQEHALEPLVEFMENHPRVGIVGSRMLWPDGEIRASPFRFLGIASEFDLAFRLGLATRLLSHWIAVPPAPDEPAKVDWVSGASLLLRRTMLEEIGLLDDGLYTYFDDIDISWRAKQAGWETWYVPDSKVIHLGGASTGLTRKSVKRRPAYWYQARRRFFLKSYGKLYTAVVDAAYIIGFSLFRLRRRIQRKPDLDPPHALWDFVRHSVYGAGFALEAVKNPALPENQPVAVAAGQTLIPQQGISQP